LQQFGAYTESIGIGPFLLESAKRRQTCDTPAVRSPQDALRQTPYGRSISIHIDNFGDCRADSLLTMTPHQITAGLNITASSPTSQIRNISGGEKIGLTVVYSHTILYTQ